MAASGQTARFAPYVQELFENEYVQQNLRDGVDQLRSAYRRSQKRGVEPTRDERLRRQIASAARSINEAGNALRSGRRKPKPRWRVRLAVIGGLTAAGAVTAAWAKERLGASGGDAEQAPQASAA
jgi:hypothetical protein